MAKTATFGVMHLVTSFSVTYGLTGSLTIAGVVTFVEPTVNTIMHYFFDKYWDHPRMQGVRQAVANIVRPGRRIARPRPPWPTKGVTAHRRPPSELELRRQKQTGPLWARFQCGFSEPSSAHHFSTKARSIT